MCSVLSRLPRTIFISFVHVFIFYLADLIICTCNILNTCSEVNLAKTLRKPLFLTV